MQIEVQRDGSLVRREIQESTFIKSLFYLMMAVVRTLEYYKYSQP